MMFAAHSAGPAGQGTRKVLTATTINVQDLDYGRYIVYGRLGNAEATLAPSPNITNAPIPFTGIWPQSMGYVTEIDVEPMMMHGLILNGQDTTTVYQKKVTFSFYLQMKSGITSNFWNSSATAEQRVYQRNGMRRWVQYQYRQPDGAGGASWGVSKWFAVVDGGGANTLVPRLYNSQYMCDLSFQSNFEIDSYTPATPIALYHGAGWGNGLSYYDGVAIITLNSISVSGTPSFATGGVTPSWVKAFTVTAGKKARLIVDLTGYQFTVFGVELAADATVV